MSNKENERLLDRANDQVSGKLQNQVEKRASGAIGGLCEKYFGWLAPSWWRVIPE